MIELIRRNAMCASSYREQSCGNNVITRTCEKSTRGLMSGDTKLGMKGNLHLVRAVNINYIKVILIILSRYIYIYIRELYYAV